MILHIVIPLWVCAFICFVIAFLLSITRPNPNSGPVAAWLRAWNWVALGLCFLTLAMGGPIVLR